MSLPNDQAQRATAKIAESAGVLQDSAVQQVDSADRRTELAADRTVLAAERTYAAWVRTGFAALASGVGAKTLLAGMVRPWLGAVAGTLLVLFSVFCFGAGVWREMTPHIVSPVPTTRRMPPPLLIAMNGFLMLVSLVALVGIWMKS
ncbi:YidH family protein [Sphingomonas oligophenolica]|uniref:DUF202 domain-containing protein n=1 Tax=Sphingomonas oligophenolica TaxID=301154 RepID=A0A502C4D7_9SPHN|nr:DUF202 domain-containing protein [Sphingomonas oligophenolica]TPG07494.1 DUF202 domain-containing protein [Sphingomonas oligophenolica]